MASTSKLHVAIYNDTGVYKHWSLFVEGPTTAEKFILHVMGSSKRYRFEMRSSNARASKRLFDLVYLCDVDNSQIDTIKETAENLKIHNESSGYNCQDYVLDLMEALEEENIIDAADDQYQLNKQTVKDKQEGFA